MCFTGRDTKVCIRLYEHYPENKYSNDILLLKGVLVSNLVYK